MKNLFNIEIKYRMFKCLKKIIFYTKRNQDKEVLKQIYTLNIYKNEKFYKNIILIF